MKLGTPTAWRWNGPFRSYIHWTPTRYIEIFKTFIDRESLIQRIICLFFKHIIRLRTLHAENIWTFFRMCLNVFKNHWFNETRKRQLSVRFDASLRPCALVIDAHSVGHVLHCSMLHWVVDTGQGIGCHAARYLIPGGTMSSDLLKFDSCTHAHQTPILSYEILWFAFTDSLIHIYKVS